MTVTPSEYVLPNGLAVQQSNTHETLHLYQDIFEQGVYLKHGISLAGDPIIIDAGANIGLFTLFALSSAPTATIHAFEPAPKTFARLRANTRGYGNVHVNNCGLDSHTGTEVFTYLPHSTCGSGYYDAVMIQKQKERLQKAILADPKRSAPFRGDGGSELLRQELNRSFMGERVLTPVRTLSSYIDEHSITGVQLLKVDVEGKELAVLGGIRDEHWSTIDQLVIEVHSRIDDLLPQVIEVLAERHYTVSTVPEDGYLTTMVYARR
jgi:FkbM family methyltransferase